MSVKLPMSQPKTVTTVEVKKFHSVLVHRSQVQDMLYQVCQEEGGGQSLGPESLRGEVSLAFHSYH
jgi:hypothetical protein